MLLWPFTWQRFHADWTFIVDLAIWGILGAGLIAALVFRTHKEKIWRTGLSLLVLYIGVCGTGRFLSGRLLPQSSFFYPEPFGPRCFRGVSLEGGVYSVHQIWPFEGREDLLERLEEEEKSDVVKAARHSSAGIRLDGFFSTPVWRLSKDGAAAEVYGLGFRSKFLPGLSPFIFRVTPDGRVERR